MLLDLIRDLSAGAAPSEVVPAMLFVVICVLLSLSMHECAHGFAAYKLGDPTARNLGRLTLSPAKHLDPIGTLCMLLFGFGWAKPVPVNARYFKKPRRDMAITAFAGPASNLILAFVALLIFDIILALPIYLAEGSLQYNILIYTLTFFRYLHTLNLYLAIFNLIPIPPLDGSRLLFIFLPDRLYFGLMQYEWVIHIVILALLWTGFLSVPLSFICGLISNGMDFLISLIPGL